MAYQPFDGRYQLASIRCGIKLNGYSFLSNPFVIMYTLAASDKCMVEKRKTINGEDILWAMQSLGFENYAEALKIYLVKYREVWSGPLRLHLLQRRTV